MDTLPQLVAEVLILSAIATWYVMPFIKRSAWRHGAVAQPDGVRRLHAQPTPLWGGLGLFLGVTFAVTSVYAVHPTGLAGVLGPFGLAVCMLGLVGLSDDIRPLSARLKLLYQIGIALFLVLSGPYPKDISLLGHYIHIGWFGVIFMMGWLVLGTNAMNLIDGMDGLASVLGIVISAAIAVIAGVHGNLPALVLAVATAGGLAGFLVHNLPPAKIFLGDSGSTVVGLTLSYLAIQVTVDASATVHVTSLTLLLFVPLLDTCLAITRRLLWGRNIFHGDRGHLHHQLLGRGFSVWRTLGLLGAFCAVSATAGCLAAVASRELAAWVAVLGSTGALIAGGYIGRQELTRVWQALSGAASVRGLRSEVRPPTSDLRPLTFDLRPLISDHESARPSEERRVA